MLNADILPSLAVSPPIYESMGVSDEIREAVSHDGLSRLWVARGAAPVVSGTVHSEVDDASKLIRVVHHRDWNGWNSATLSKSVTPPGPRTVR